MKRLPSIDRHPLPRRQQAGARLRAARGFTLIELMITVALAAILTAVAAPSMTRTFRANRVQTEASSFISDLQYARTEAIRRGRGVSVCPSSDGASCLTANTWHSGWIVFSDKAGDGVYDTGAGDAVLRVRKGFTGGDTFVVAPVPATVAVTFNREGFTSNLGAAKVIFTLHTSDNVASAARCVNLDLAGRTTTLLPGDSCT